MPKFNPPNTIIEGPETSEIIMPTGERILIDTTDLDLVKKHKWSIKVRSRRRGRDLIYAGTWNGNSANPRTVLLHRLLLNAPKGTEVDHRDGNTLDCRRSNLRLATPTQNRVNSGPTAQHRSGYRGVRYDKRSGQWIAQMNVDKRSKQIGRFDTKEAAAEAYNRAAREYHGEFAYQNPVPSTLTIKLPALVGDFAAR